MPDIIHRVGIKAQADKVYKAVSTADGVANWWTKETTGGSKIGEILTFTFREDDGVGIKGQMEAKVTELSPNKRVSWRITKGPAEWIGTDITFDLKQEGDYTIVNFGHRNWKEAIEFMGHCSLKWGVFMMSLKELVEKGQGKPAPHDIKIDNWN